MDCDFQPVNGRALRDNIVEALARVRLLQDSGTLPASERSRSSLVVVVDPWMWICLVSWWVTDLSEGQSSWEGKMDSIVLSRAAVIPGEVSEPEGFCIRMATDTA